MLDEIKFGLTFGLFIQGEVAYVDGQVLTKPGYGKNITALSKRDGEAAKPKLAVPHEDNLVKSEFHLSESDSSLKTLKSSMPEQSTSRKRLISNAYLNGK